MTMQIREVVLYSHTGELRRLQLRLGAVNIITGGSKTGKSALIDIVEYCLGREHCYVAEGVIRESVAWYGILLQFPDTQCFIARRDPGPRRRTSSDVFLNFASDVRIPSLDELVQTTTPEALVKILSEKIGISPNIHEPPLGTTRQPLQANLKHALFLIFQRQDEIAKRTILFHRQDEEFVPQAIKDTLPYFLGAVREDMLAKRHALRRERVTLRQLERQAAEATALRADRTPRAMALIAEAENAGLIAPAEGPLSLDQALALLRTASERPQQDATTQRTVSDALGQLREARSGLVERYRRAKDQLEAATSFLREQGGFLTEVAAQRARLQSVELFSESDAEIDHCPVCNSAVETPVPSVNSLQNSLNTLNAQLSLTADTRPRLDSYIEDLENEITSIQQQMRENQSSISALIAQDQALAERSSVDEKRAYVRGRISHYIENTTGAPSDESAAEKALEESRRRVAALEEELRDEKGEEVVTSILNLISRAMSKWAAELQLEYSNLPIRIDLPELTVVADSENGPIPMFRMGSGENWIGCHIVAHLALHRWFVNKGRPVPRFLFLDQPTQVFYPPEHDADGKLDILNDEDRTAVRRMFGLILREIGKLTPGMQVIITDHADVDDPSFQSAVVERWRGGLKLVPPSWQDQGGQSSSE